MKTQTKLNYALASVSAPFMLTLLSRNYELKYGESHVTITHPNLPAPIVLGPTEKPDAYNMDHNYPLTPTKSWTPTNAVGSKSICPTYEFVVACLIRFCVDSDFSERELAHIEKLDPKKHLFFNSVDDMNKAVPPDENASAWSAVGGPYMYVRDICFTSEQSGIRHETYSERGYDSGLVISIPMDLRDLDNLQIVSFNDQCLVENGTYLVVDAPQYGVEAKDASHQYVAYRQI